MADVVRAKLLLQMGLRRELRLFVRKAFATLSPGTPYVHGWHVEAIAHCVMEVHERRSRRLLINQPPRSLKSILIAIAYVAWLLGHDPSRRVIVASYSGEFAAELHRLFRVLVDAPWFKELFPNLRWARHTAAESVTTKQGGRLATSIGGVLTGRGADLIIVDDPMNAADAQSDSARKSVNAWFDNALLSRLNDKATGAVIVVMQRLHEEDLAGHLIEKGGWDHLCLPALATDRELISLPGGRTKVRLPDEPLHAERESRETLLRIKEEIGSAAFSCQYQQAPVPLEGNLIKRAWLKFYDRLPTQGPGDRIVQSWDLAIGAQAKSDYNVCTTWLVLGSDYYLFDVFRERLDYPGVRKQIAALGTRHRANAVLVEEAGPGIPVLQELRRNLPGGMLRPIGIRPQGSKADRLAAHSARIEAGQVHLPNAAPWLGDFLHEVLAFPNGRHDDQVDSLSQFLEWVSRPTFDDVVLYVPDHIPNPRKFTLD